MKCAIVLLSFLAFAAAQDISVQSVLIPNTPYPACVTCTRRAGFFNGNYYQQCNQFGSSTYQNCVSCCTSWAISQGKNPSQSAGLLSQNNMCVCCIPCN
ncbi:hypothetical protein Tcan_03172 [Toxocara canis]|uniref:Uncharacterized protein n=1 Tax=Toxocara canis TaxID=6265 RepID=A0A0B2V138_TOXCA|nr:hypothetical protein Tcan_03172 [Toxocara canis]